MPRPKRNRREQIEDLFADLPADQQEQCLRDLAKLQRWCLRLRVPQLDPALPANGQMTMETE